MELSVRRITGVGVAFGMLAVSASSAHAQLLDRLRGRETGTRIESGTRIEEPGGRYYVVPNQGERVDPSREGRVIRSGTDSRGTTEYRGDTEYRSGERAQTRGSNLSRSRRGTSLIGATVRLDGGRTMGRVEDIIIGESGNVDFLIVSVSGLRGLSGRLAALPFAVGDVDFGRRIVYVDWAEDELRRAPIFFSAAAWPDFGSDWTEDVFVYFEIDSHDGHSGRAYREPRQSDRDRSDDRSSHSHDRDYDRDSDRSNRQDSRSERSTRDSNDRDQDRGRSDTRSRSRDENDSSDRSNRSNDYRDRSNRDSSRDSQRNSNQSDDDSDDSQSRRSKNSNKNEQPD